MENVEHLKLSSETRAASGDTLALLAEMGQQFVSTGDIDEALKIAVSHIAKYVGAEGGALFMLDEAGEKLRCHACFGDTDITGLTIDADQGIVGDSVQNNTSEIIRDVNQDSRFHKGVDEETGTVTRSILCAPMSVKDERIGAIELINKATGDGRFDEIDLSLLTALSSSAALAIINARMAEKLVEQERLARELELAAEIQRSLLPDEDNDLPIFGINMPARTVSGDFFDYFPLDDGRVMFNLGDVSGKGMNAALLMAKTASLFRCLGKTIDHPGELMARVNVEICETATRGMFVTMVGGVYDPQTGDLLYANAGHEPPLMQHADGTFEDFPADAPPLGISPLLIPEEGYPVEAVNLKGGAFYLFTDGVTEGYIDDGSELGIEGVHQYLNAGLDADMHTRLSAIIKAVHGTGEPLRDDLTILGIDDRAGFLSRQEEAVKGDIVEEIGEIEQISVILVPSSADRLKLVRSMIGDSARLVGFSDKLVLDLVLAVDEACQNVIRHAYNGRENGLMEITVSKQGRKMIVDVRDEAATVDPSTVKPRDLEDIRPGGLGTHLIQEIMDTVDFLAPHEEGGNILRMTKKIE